MNHAGGTDEDETGHLVPLSLQAIEILREPQSFGDESRYVFPGRNQDKPISNNTILFALYRLGYKRRMTGHGFRAIATTLLNEASVPSDVIENASSRTSSATTCAGHTTEPNIFPSARP